MANTVKIKRSGTPSATPSSLEHGELAINYADGIVFWKSSSNTIRSFEFINYLPNASVSTFGKSLIDDADAATARTTLGAAASASPTFTGTVTVPAGTVTAPAVVSTTGTSDTGIWFPAADTIAWSTGGSERMRIDSSGNVTLATGQLLADDSTSVSAPVYSFDGDANTGIGHPAADVVTVSTGGSERLRIDASGNVGIGTASPTAPLHVSRSLGGEIRLTETGVSGADWGLLPQTGNSVPLFRIYDRSKSVDRMAIDTNGNVGIGTTGPTISSGVGLHLSGSTLRLGTARTPASSSATGNTGEICWDASYLYICTATNTWRRISHASW